MQNSKITETTVYQTTDGQIYREKNEAIEKQARLDIAEKISDAFSSLDDVWDFVNWIQHNSSIVTKFLTEVKDAK